MPDKNYVIRFTDHESGVQPVKAATAELVEGYWVLLHDDGSLSAFFDAAFVESCMLDPNSK